MSRSRMINRWAQGTCACVCLAGTLLSTSPTSAAIGPGRPARMHRLQVESSIKVPPETVARAQRAGRTAYSAVLSPYAKVTVKSAREAALAQAPGARVEDVVLQAMRENLVYIALLRNDHTRMRHIVFIDAGTGRVLADRSVRMRDTEGRGDMPQRM
jgi:uncharacterized iron-regulated membrane protein